MDRRLTQGGGDGERSDARLTTSRHDRFTTRDVPLGCSCWCCSCLRCFSPASLAWRRRRKMPATTMASSDDISQEYVTSLRVYGLLLLLLLLSAEE